jgi:hypothetical protein
VTDDDPIDLGPCCACRQPGPTVRNIMMLAFRAPVPGKGWGCFQCGLPQDGAVAVVCDACMESDAPILDVCHGYASSSGRVARETCNEPFEHDMTRHPGEQ